MCSEFVVCWRKPLRSNIRRSGNLMHDPGPELGLTVAMGMRWDRDPFPFWENCIEVYGLTCVHSPNHRCCPGWMWSSGAAGFAPWCLGKAPAPHPPSTYALYPHHARLIRHFNNDLSIGEFSLAVAWPRKILRAGRPQVALFLPAANLLTKH